MNTPTGNTPTGNTFDKYASTNPIERRMMQGFFRSLDAMLPAAAPQAILEVGCGEGEILERLAARYPHARLVGIDLPDDGLRAEWTRRGLPAEEGDATALRFADGEFDLVLAIEVLEHVPQPQRALAELARVCSNTAVLSVPLEPVWRMGNMARGRYLRQWGNTPGHVNHWGRRSFRRFVGSRFTVDEVASPLPWTMVRGTVAR